MKVLNVLESIKTENAPGQMSKVGKKQQDDTVGISSHSKRIFKQDNKKRTLIVDKNAPFINLDYQVRRPKEHTVNILST